MTSVAPAGTAMRGIWKNGEMPSRLIVPTLGPWIFGVGTVFSACTNAAMPFSYMIRCSARRAT